MPQSRRNSASLNGHGHSLNGGSSFGGVTISRGQVICPMISIPYRPRHSSTKRCRHLRLQNGALSFSLGPLHTPQVFVVFISFPPSRSPNPVIALLALKNIAVRQKHTY